MDYQKKYKNSSNKMMSSGVVTAKTKPMFSEDKNKLDWYDQQLYSGVSTDVFVDRLMKRAKQS
jgi:hypothetical protein